MQNRLLFVINPHAGKGAIREDALACIDCFIQAGYDVTVHITQGTQDATRIVRERACEFDRIVCSGGDGTLNEVVAGLLDSGVKTPLGYIPAGTVNDFASSLRIPRQPLAAAELAVSGQPYAVDIGRFGNRCFCYIAAFGAFTDVSYTTPQTNKNLLGRTAYILEAIKALPAIKPYHIKVQAGTQQIEGDFIYGMVTNATSVGGFKELAPADVQMDDGVFEVVLLQQPKKPLEWQQVFNEFIQPQKDSKYLLRLKASHIQIQCDEAMPWTLDGEFGGKHNTVEIRNEFHALSILVRGI